MRTLLGAVLLLASAACVGAMPDPEERGKGLGIGELPGADPGTADGADLAVGWPLCAPCASDAACGGRTRCNVPAGVCEHTSGYCASNTRGLRPEVEIDRIVIHTAEGPAEAAVDWFLSTTSGVSAHYVVDGDGAVKAVVSEAATAKHTGNIAYDRRSIGIELEGQVDRPMESYTAEMYEAAASLVRDLAARHGLALDRSHVVGHREVPDPAAGAEYCGGWGHHGDPGDGFDWERLMALLLGETVSEPPGARWFGRAAFDPEIVAVSHPTSARPGEALEVTVLADNAGRTVWEQTRLRLVASDAGAQELFVFGRWASRERPNLGGLGCHGPDTSAELTFTVRAPDAAERRTVGGAFQLELFDRSFALQRSAAFHVRFDVVPPGAQNGAAWEGMTDHRALAQGEEARYETPPLAPGSYRFEMAGEGDADLYVRAGAPPTQDAYDCRPYRADSMETCDVTLAAETPVFVMVRGYRAGSFQLSGRPLR